MIYQNQQEGLKAEISEARKQEPARRGYNRLTGGKDRVYALRARRVRSMTCP